MLVVVQIRIILFIIPVKWLDLLINIRLIVSTKDPGIVPLLNFFDAGVTYSLERDAFAIVQPPTILLSVFFGAAHLFLPCVSTIADKVDIATTMKNKKGKKQD